MIGESLTKYQVAVLQSVANCVGSVGQLTRVQSVKDWLQDEEGEPLDGFDEAVIALEKECLVERKEYKGIPHLALTDDGYRCNRIDVSGIM